MKKKIRELDVDFIGAQKKPLTKEEDLAISKHLKSSKEDRERLISKRRKRLTKAHSKAFN